MRTQSQFRRILLPILPAICVLTIAIHGFCRQGPSAAYNGIWKGQYEGRVFLLLTLSPDNRNSLKGQIAIGDVNVDGNGEVNEVRSEARDAVAISDVSLKQDVLTFKAKSDNDLLGHRLKVTGTDKAKLQIDGAPPNVKPFTLDRVSKDN